MSKKSNVPEDLLRFGKNLKGLPIEKRPRVYFLVHRKEIVYVGQSIDLAMRVRSHRDKEFDSVFYINVDEEDVNAVETELISEFSPPLNRQGLREVMGYTVRLTYRPLNKALKYYAEPRNKPYAWMSAIDRESMREAVEKLCRPELSVADGDKS